MVSDISIHLASSVYASYCFWPPHNTLFYYPIIPAHMFIQIGEVISKFAEDAEKLTEPPRTMPPQPYPTAPMSEDPLEEDTRRWHDERRITKHSRDHYERPAYSASASERPTSHAPPSRTYSMPDYPSEYTPISRHSTENQPTRRPSTREISDVPIRRSEQPYHPGPSTPPPRRDVRDDPHMDMPVNRKRHAPTELDQPVKHPSSPRPNIDTTRPSAFKAKNKRIRINWSQAENQVFFDTIEKYSNEDESTVLKEIVSALDGSRNWVQCKGHFRNLQYVGRIAQTDTNPKQWIVVDSSKSPKPSTSKPSSSTGEKNADSADDDTGQIQAKYGHNGALQQPMDDFDEHDATATGVTTITTNAEDKHDTERGDQMTIHNEHDDGDEQDESFQPIPRDDDRVDNNSNGHVPRKSGKNLRGMRNADIEIHHGDGSDLPNISTSMSRIDADHVNNRDTQHVSQFSRRVSQLPEHRREFSMPLKKQQSSSATNPTNTNASAPQLRSRDQDRRRQSELRLVSNRRLEAD